MTILVQKYGGSSVATVEKLGLVADKVVAAKRLGHDVVVVVSAMGKTTDGLISLAKSVADDPPRRELDMLVSTGERVSMALLSIAIQARGEDAISFTGSQSGIITSDRHFDARIIEVRPHRIEDELHRGRIVIVAGYQGMSYRREITTLGRGGSDTTAVALAAALGAERCEIYSDGDGVYSADPRVVPEARHLPEVDLASLQEMAEAGAKVLNAQAVEWARRAKIAIHARKTQDPVDAAGGVARETVAHEGATSRARAVVGQGAIVLADVAVEAAPRVIDHAARLGVPMLDVFVGRREASFAIPLLNVPDWQERRARLLEEAGGAVTLHEGRALVSVVGDGMSDALPRFYAALREAGAAPQSTSGGPLRLSAVVDAAHLDAAQRALHAAFVT
ncbi:MAG: aspartate kinase [Myxococcales bacterium]|nr:aspartate kinase [Myxococcales bacterium]